MMKSIIFVFILLNAFNALEWHCDFDYGDKCFIGLPTISYVLLNGTSDRPRQPASDVWAIQTSNSQGSCLFPFQHASFDMYFCLRTLDNTPAVCPNVDQPTTFINCNDYGEYGYHMFDKNETDDRSYELDISRPINAGPHCLRFFHFFSDDQSDASIRVVVQDDNNLNETVLEIWPRSNPDRWQEIRHNFRLINTVSKIYFVFRRGVSGPDPFFIAIDEIRFLETICDYTAIEVPTTTQPSTSTVISSIANVANSSREVTHSITENMHITTGIRLNDTNTSPLSSTLSTTRGPPVCNRTMTIPHYSTNSVTGNNHETGTTRTPVRETSMIQTTTTNPNGMASNGTVTTSSGALIDETAASTNETPLNGTVTPSRGTPGSQTPSPSRSTLSSQTPTPSRGTPLSETTTKPSFGTVLVCNAGIILLSAWFQMALVLDQ